MNTFAEFFYKYGEIPANIVGGIATLILILSYFIPSLKKYRTPCLILVLTWIIAAGIIVNGIFKEFWGRPRPRQIVEFGGDAPFFPFYKPNFGESYKSFPCGHCTMGFYFLTFAVIGYRYHSKFLLYGGLLVGLLFGLALSYIRIVQGGHFLTDTLGAAVIVWLTALTMDWLLKED